MTKALDSAMRLLGRREHSAKELAGKLAQKGYEAVEISELLIKCQQLGLQSDARFAESLCRVRIRQGYGPLKISQELQAKQVDPDLIKEVLEQERDNWYDYALAVWHRKYKDTVSLSYLELQKRQRFLLYRGFSTDVIASVVATIRGGG